MSEPKTSYPVKRLFPKELEELIESHKSHWIADSKGGEVILYTGIGLNLQPTQESKGWINEIKRGL